MGKKGCIVAKKTEIKYIAGMKVEKVIDTTGAGDVFAAALLTRLAKGIEIHEAVEFANMAAAKKVTKIGREGYPTEDEVVNFINY
jgi:ribokinase